MLSISNVIRICGASWGPKGRGDTRELKLAEHAVVLGQRPITFEHLDKYNKVVIHGYREGLRLAGGDGRDKASEDTAGGLDTTSGKLGGHCTRPPLRHPELRRCNPFAAEELFDSRWIVDEDDLYRAQMNRETRRKRAREGNAHPGCRPS